MGMLFGPPEDVLACCVGLSPDDVTAYVMLTESISERWRGEAGVVVAGKRVWVVERVSLLETWRLVSADALALEVVQDGWTRSLRVKGLGGERYEVSISSLKADEILRALGTVVAPARERLLGVMKATQGMLLGVLRAKVRAGERAAARSKPKPKPKPLVVAVDRARVRLDAKPLTSARKIDFAPERAGIEARRHTKPPAAAISKPVAGDVWVEEEQGRGWLWALVAVIVVLALLRVAVG